MKSPLLIILLFILFSQVHAQTIWTGPEITFTKADSVDWTDPVNQDSLSPSVILTRATKGGIFNIKQEAEYDRNQDLSPLGTEWANGSISEGIGNLTFSSWFASLDGPTPEEVGKAKVLHLIAEDIYLNVVFTQWTGGGGGSGTGFGGGFSYRRSTPGTTDIQSAEPKETGQIYWDASTQKLHIHFSAQQSPYNLADITGRIIQSGLLKQGESLQTQALRPGIYLVRLTKPYPFVGKFLIR